MLSKKQMTKNIVVSLLLSFGALYAEVQKGPYLIYDGVNTEMTVLWQLDSSQSCTIDWGVDTSYATGNAVTGESGSGTNEHQHKYTITGLTPGTKYFYQVICDAESVGYGSFQTAPLDNADNVKFIVYGDTRTYPADHDAVSQEMINTYTLDPEYQTITLHVGDWVNNGDVEADWAIQFFDPSWLNTNEFQANMPINGVRGNHEDSGDLFYKYFPYLYEPDGFYWSFDYGPAHITVIDQYVPYTLGSTQYAWLENDLASSTKKWKFLVFHEPGWSAGGHSNNANVQDYIQPLAVEKGVSMIFAGHNHYYARAVVDGIQHVTTGGGGAPLYTPVSNSENVVATAKVHHFCEVEIQGDDLWFVARDTSGSEFDSFQLNQLASSSSVAYSDIPVKGTVSGSYADTHELDNIMESITERSSGGKPSNRYSYLEHKWAFNVQPGAAVTLFAEVTASASSDRDSFAFAWSTDDVVYTTMFTVDASSASAQSYSLLPSTSGTVYVRVIDTDRTAGTSQALDTVSIDQIFIRTDKEQGDPPEAPSDLTAIADSASEISLLWTDNATDEYGFHIERSNGSAWVEIATVGPDVTAYTDSGLLPSTNYRYRVSAYNGAGNSAYSDESTATTEAGAAITLSVQTQKVRAEYFADLVWNGAASDNIGIYRDGSKITTMPNSGTYSDNLGKKPAGSYVYQVCEEETTADCSDEVVVSF